MASGKENENSLAGIEENQPAKDGQGRQEELACYGEYQGYHQQGRNAGLDYGARRLNDAQAENAGEGQQQILSIVGRPLMLPQCVDGACGREGGLECSERGGW